VAYEGLPHWLLPLSAHSNVALFGCSTDVKCEAINVPCEVCEPLKHEAIHVSP
jgi:hypothetical protein